MFSEAQTVIHYKYNTSPTQKIMQKKVKHAKTHCIVHSIWLFHSLYKGYYLELYHIGMIVLGYLQLSRASAIVYKFMREMMV